MCHCRQMGQAIGVHTGVQCADATEAGTGADGPEHIADGPKHINTGMGSR